MSFHDDDIMAAYAHGQDGGGFLVDSTAQPVASEIGHLQTQMPLPWLITLGAIAPQGGIIGGDVGSQDPNLIAQLGLKARIQWGGRNAQEIADIDWPIGGCTVAVNGETVRLFGVVNPQALTVGTIKPQVQGWITPDTHGRGRSLLPPTFTYPLTVWPQNVGGFVDFTVPKRARAYRIGGFWTLPTGDQQPLDGLQFAADATQELVVKQLQAPAATVSVDWGSVSADLAPYPSSGMWSDAAAWVPLHAATTRIRCITTVAPTAPILVSVYAQFALDLG